MLGVSFWTKDDGEKLVQHILVALSKNKENRNIFYEQIPLAIYKHSYKVYLKQITKDDASEIDTLEDLDNLSKKLSCNKRFTGLY